MIAERIKALREANHMTQSELAKILELTRASVNAWEMGTAVPSTQYVIRLAKLFGVTADYILGMETENVISTAGLTEADVNIVYMLVLHLQGRNSPAIAEAAGGASTGRRFAAQK